MIVIALLAYWCRKRTFKNRIRDLVTLVRDVPQNLQLNEDEALNDQAHKLPFNDEFEVSPSALICSDVILGEGEFGKVYRGELKTNWMGERRTVAIKVPKDPTDTVHYQNLIAEFKLMTYIRYHVNVLRLVGACTKRISKMELFVLTEYCELGSLDKYLSEHWHMLRESVASVDGPPSLINSLLSYAYQAANGMEHLANNFIIHRDLALRNLLVTKDHVIKISDFGMSRRHETAYERRLSPNVAIPLRWMALESLINGQFTQKSDVWSFGIVLWEIFSCTTPYEEGDASSYINDGVPAFVYYLQRGGRLSQPAVAPAEMYQLMMNCWHKEPNERPTFSSCKRHISAYLESFSPSLYSSILNTLSEAWVSAAPSTGRYEVQNSDTTQSPLSRSSSPPISTPRSNWGPTDVAENIPLIEAEELPEVDMVSDTPYLTPTEAQVQTVFEINEMS